MKMDRLLTVRSHVAWRRWLSKNHDREGDVWLVFFKRVTGEPSLPYDDAVEEALCFGWIDSLIRRIDDRRYARKFTPRKDTTTWSPSNRARAARLLRDGRMTPAGLAKVGYGDAAAIPAPERPLRAAVLPDSLSRKLRENRAACPKRWGCSAGGKNWG